MARFGEHGVSEPSPRYCRALCTIFEMDAQALGLLPRSSKKGNKQQVSGDKYEEEMLGTVSGNEGATLPSGASSSVVDNVKQFKGQYAFSLMSGPSTTLMRFFALSRQVFRQKEWQWRFAVPIMLLLFLLISGSVLYAMQRARQQVMGTQTVVALTNGTRTASTLSASALEQLYLATTSRPSSIPDPLSEQSTIAWEKGSDCVFQGEMYHVFFYKPHTVPSGYTICTAMQSRYCDFAYQAQMTILHGDGGGLVFRSSLAGEYRFRVDADGSYDIVNYDHQLKKGMMNEMGASLAVSNNLTVIAQGKHLSLYVNGRGIADITDDTDDAVNWGRIGFMAVGASSTNEVVLSQAKIWQL